VLQESKYKITSTASTVLLVEIGGVITFKPSLPCHRHPTCKTDRWGTEHPPFLPTLAICSSHHPTAENLMTGFDEHKGHVSIIRLKLSQAWA